MVKTMAKSLKSQKPAKPYKVSSLANLAGFLDLLIQIDLANKSTQKNNTTKQEQVKD